MRERERERGGDSTILLMQLLLLLLFIAQPTTMGHLRAVLVITTLNQNLTTSQKMHNNKNLKYAVKPIKVVIIQILLKTFIAFRK